MKCVFCGGKVEKKIVTFSHQDEEHCLFVEGVPAEVCKACGEKTYSPEVADKLLGLSKDKPKPSKTIQVPVYEFA